LVLAWLTVAPAVTADLEALPGQVVTSLRGPIVVMHHIYLAWV